MPFSRYEALKFKLKKKTRKDRFPQCQNKKMENDNRIRDVTVDHFVKKKETICHTSVIWDTKVIKLFTVRKAYWTYSHKIFIVVRATELQQNKFN